MTQDCQDGEDREAGSNGDPLDWLRAVEGLASPSEHLLILLRHSVREEIREDKCGSDALLTAEGLRLAERLGRSLRRRVSSIVSSPVIRCLETALAIQVGIGSRVATSISSLLAEPGAFVLPGDAAQQFLSEARGLEMVNLLLEQSRTPGLRRLEHGCQLLIGLLRGLTAAPGCATLLVSHDSVVAPFVYGLLGRRQIGWGDWPQCLEGCGLCLNPSSLRLRWRSCAAQIPLPPP